MSQTNPPIRQQIATVLCRVFDLTPDLVERGVSPEQIEKWDSEKHVELVVALEDCFGFMFEAEEVPELTSLEQIEAIVNRHGRTGEA